jgi:hypothetical protein
MKILKVLICAGAMLSVSLPIVMADDYVNGYVKRDGTYVPPHYRSPRDGDFGNNWSTKGNENPYTGKEGTRVKPPRDNGGFGGGFGTGLKPIR